MNAIHEIFLGKLPGFADLTGYDALAALFLVLSWLLVGWWVEDRPHRKSASTLMFQHRMAWMREMARRNPRILDGNLLGGLQHSASFFASTALLGLGGVLAMLGQAPNLGEVAHAVPFSGPVSADGLRLRLAAPLFFIAYAFFKFAWSQRLFGYCSVLMGATPEWDASREEEILAAADRAGVVNGLAARSFNRGLRSLYFTLGSLAWLIGPLALVLSTCAVVLMINRREFHSESRKAINT
jgi:uncharacterized membrane protein